MRPERFLGVDPAPGDLAGTDVLIASLREVVRELVEARGRIDAQLPADGVWSGPVAAPLTEAFVGLSRRLLLYEDVVVDVARAVDGWRAGLAARTDRTAELVEQASRLGGQGADAEAEGRRQALQMAVAEVQRDHEAAAQTLHRQLDEVRATLQVADALGLADQVDRAGDAVLAAVEEWVREQAAEVTATAESLVQVAGLTTVVTELVGVTGLDRAPLEGDGVAEVAGHGAGAHRLLAALGRAWTDVAPTSLPIATFAVVGGSAGSVLADRVQGRSRPDADSS